MEQRMNHMIEEEQVDVEAQIAEINNLADDVSAQEAEQKQNRNLLKKKKPDFNLYKVFQSVQSMLETCTPTLDEMFVRNEEGLLVFTEAASCLADYSPEMKEALKSTLDLFKQVDGQPDRLRKGFIKDKVILTRYSRRGAEYAQQYDELADKIFSMSALIVTIQSGLSDAVFGYEKQQGENVNV